MKRAVVSEKVAIRLDMPDILNITCFRESHQTARMYLMYYMSVEGKRVYTLAKVDPEGKPTFSAHPAR